MAIIGQLNGLDIRDNLEEMQIGDLIPCEYVANSGVVGTFANLGTATKDLIPVTGSATPNGSFYFVKVDDGLLIADRVIQHSISWDTLNAGKMIEGTPLLGGLIRSLSGGVAYLDANGNPSATNQGLGAYPSINEWDKYIVGSDLGGKIVAGDDNVWHWSNLKWGTLCKETPSLQLTNAISSRRICRGTTGSVASLKGLMFDSSNTITAFEGFRPALQLQNPKQTNLFY